MLVSICVLLFHSHLTHWGSVVSSIILSVGFGSNVSLVFKVFAVLFGSVLYVHHPVVNLEPGLQSVHYLSSQNLCDANGDKTHA